MSIRIRKSYIALHSVTCTAVEPEYQGFTKEKIKEYMKDNPMPHDEHYDEQDCLYDLTDSGGSLTFSEDLKEETIKYLEDLMNWLIDDWFEDIGINTKMNVVIDRDTKIKIVDQEKQDKYKNTRTVTQIIEEISIILSECPSGEFIEDIANRILTHKVKYIGDSMFEQEE